MRIKTVGYWNIRGYLCYSGRYNGGVLEYWSVGLKTGNRSDFFSFTFGYARSNYRLSFSILSAIQQSITPILQVQITTSLALPEIPQQISPLDN
jgi:hypothetical protein